MRKNVILYYALLLLMVMGAFASMALNSYGVPLMGYASLGFSLLFAYELFFLLPRKKSIRRTDKRIIGLELITLFTICLFYFFRAAAIEIPFDVNPVPMLLIVLLGLNGYQFYRTTILIKEPPLKLKVGVLLYFLTLFLVLAASYLLQFQSSAGVYLTIAAFFGWVGFVVIGWWRGKVIVNGEETSAMKVASRFKNKSGLELISFSLLIAYSSLNAINLLPPLYFGSMPNGYLKVLRQAEVVKNQTDPGAKSADPKEFEKSYKRFIKGK
jgi:hypothetical protein